MKDKDIVLSGRLAMLAGMVTVGNRVADVGCDHGFLPIYLVQSGISPGAIAMDVRVGPLSAAERHIEDRGLGKYIETRLSDGFRSLEPGEVDTAICAGMGGNLMERIIRESEDKVRGLNELILQPQSEIGAFRRFLRTGGYAVTSEEMASENGKYYFAMRVQPTLKMIEDMDELKKEFGVDNAPSPERLIRLCDMFGRDLLKRRHPLLRQYLEKRNEMLNNIKRNLEQGETGRSRSRLAQIEGELEDVRLALKLF